MNDIQARTRPDPAATPRYREIHDALRKKIISGAWPPGYKLAAEPELARKFDCARMTMSKALGALAEQGLITRRRRAGTIVNAFRPPESVLEIHDIESEVLAAGHSYEYQCFKREPRRATANDAAALTVSVGIPVLALSGLHLADGRPHALEERLINVEAVPEARSERFNKTSPGRWLLARVPWTDAEHEISAVNADRVTAGRLEIPQRTACLCIQRRTWLAERRITFVRILYPCDQHRLVARFQRR